MTGPDGEAASRLSDAIEEILRGRRSDDAGAVADTDADADADADADTTAAAAADTTADTTLDTLAVGDPRPTSDEPWQLPEIVEATQVGAPTRRRPAPDGDVTPSGPDAGDSPDPAGAATAAAETRPVAVASVAQVAVAPALPRRDEATLPAQAVAPATAVVQGWSDLVADTAPRTLAAASADSRSSLRAPGRRPRVRRVTRVVRHVDPWSVFKVALLFSFVGYLVMLTSGVLLWRVADSTGTLDNVERWFTQFGWETFEFDGGAIFRDAWVIGLFAAIGATGAAVLAATLFNLVSDIVGGVRVTVLEEEVVERTATSARRYVVRRPASGAAAAWSVDDPAPPAPATAPAAPAASLAPSAAANADWSVD